MGKLRVHNIEAQTGTNVDLGAAGDVVTFASDSIQTNLYKDSGGNTLFRSSSRASVDPRSISCSAFETALLYTLFPIVSFTTRSAGKRVTPFSISVAIVCVKRMMANELKTWPINGSRILILSKMNFPFYLWMN